MLRSPHDIAIRRLIGLHLSRADVVIAVRFDALNQICPFSWFVPNLITGAQVTEETSAIDTDNRPGAHCFILRNQAISKKNPTREEASDSSPSSCDCSVFFSYRYEVGQMAAGCFERIQRREWESHEGQIARRSSHSLLLWQGFRPPIPAFTNSDSVSQARTQPDVAYEELVWTVGRDDPPPICKK